MPVVEMRRALVTGFLVCADASSINITSLHGVNFGGWLCLEDWFYSGQEGKHVSTEDKAGQGRSLPPMVTSLDTPWPSEGILTHRLVEAHGAAWTVEAFEAHRGTYITEQDLQQVAAAGLKEVRIPLAWSAFADALGDVQPLIYGMHDPDTEAVVVPDPYYNSTSSFVTIPRNNLVAFLRSAAKHGIKVLLDLHNFPGGSADGTYNGVWPQTPAFWTGSVGSPPTPLTDLGHKLVKALIAWVEGLDDAAFAGVGGITPMNEPAHLSSGKTWAKEQQVLDWVAVASEYFRASSLPKRGVRLYLNLIRTAFKDFLPTVSKWYHATFTQAERTSWVVMDRHYYAAWDTGVCDAHPVIANQTAPGYTCDESESAMRAKMVKCVGGDFTVLFNQYFPDDLKSCTEFSASSYENAPLACSYKNATFTNLWLEVQLQEYARTAVEPWFWTWRMPYGPVFESAWSLKYLLGLENAGTAPKPVFV